MPLDIPLPTASPFDDPEQYTPLLLSAIEGFLLARDVWADADYPEAYSYMQELMLFVVDLVANGMNVIGTVTMFAGDTQPPKWLWCNGGEVDRVIYSELFATIGTAYGDGDGSTTFNVPDFTDRSPMGTGGDFTGFPGAQAGAHEITLETSQIPAHSHAITDPGHTHRVPKQSATVNAAVNVATPAARTDNPATPHITTDSATTGITGTNNTGGGLPHGNVHPVLGVNFIIYAGIE